MLRGIAVSRSFMKFLLKLIVSLGLLWLVLSRLTWFEVRAALAAPGWTWLAAALAVYGASVWGGAMQWIWLLRAAGFVTPTGEIRRLYFIGLFFNNFLPANIGGDAYKIIDLGRRERGHGRVFCATLLDRLLGLAALTVVASLAALVCLVLGIDLPFVAWILALVLLLLLGVIAVLVSRRLGAMLPRLLGAIRLTTLADRLALMIGEFTVYRARLPWLARVFLFSMGVQTVRLTIHLLVARGLNLDPNGPQILQLAVLIPLLALSLTLPVTINGIGLRETISSTLLVYTGLSAHSVVAMEMTAFLVMITFSLVGGGLWWWQRGRIR
jgi:glycosyltransferase 2 family protein